jgi:hypothetical protein
MVRSRTFTGPVVVHWAILGAGLIVYALLAARTWFFYDDWYFLALPPGGMWSPHVGHWSTVPALVFLAVRQVFGMDHYLPFALPAILAHLAVVHFVYLLTVRSGVRPWLATAFSALLTFLGAGAEALGWAVQIGFVGAVAWMLGAVVLLDRDRLGVVRAASAAVLVLIALASSGVALAFLPSAVVLAWMRHGTLRTLAVFAVPVGAYATWFLLEGRHSLAQSSLGGFARIFAVPQFAVSMLSDGLGRMFPLAVLGGLTFTALGVWWVFTVREARARGLAAYLLFPAAPVFALLTGLARADTGLAAASSSRYVYVVVMAIAPFAAISFDRASRRAPVAPAVAIVLLLGVWNLGGAFQALEIRAERVASTRADLARVASVLHTAPSCLADSDRPSPKWAPDVTVGDVRRWLASGWYHPPGVTGPAPACDKP